MTEIDKQKMIGDWPLDWLRNVYVMNGVLRSDPWIKTFQKTGVQVFPQSIALGHWYNGKNVFSYRTDFSLN